MIRLASIGGLTLMLAVGGCSQEAAPTTQSPASTSAATTATPTCLNGQVRAHTQAVEGLMAGVGVVRIFLTNVSPARCRLEGSPDVLPIDARGRVLPHTAAELDGDFGGAAGTTLNPTVRDAAYVPISVSSRDASLEPCRAQRSVRIDAWRVRFAAWSQPLFVPAVGDLRFCEGRYRTGGVTPNPTRPRLTEATLPPAPSPTL